MSVRRRPYKLKNGKIISCWIADIRWRDAHGVAHRLRRFAKPSTKQAAEALERQLFQEVEKQRAQQQEGPLTCVPTMVEFWQEFFKNYVAVNNKPSEQAAKQSIMTHHLAPYFGTQKLDTISTRQIEAYKAYKVSLNYQAKSINNQLTLLRTLLKTALSWHIIDKIPTIKELKKPPRQHFYLSFEESKRLIDAADGEWQTMIVVALHTGMRIGELLALQWDDIDFEKGQITVRRSDWKGIVGTPKNGKHRSIPLNATVFQALKKHQHQRSQRVFIRSNNLPLTHAICRKPLLAACSKAKIKPVQWHALRHTFASHLVMKKVPLRAVQILLGHASYSTTEMYAHLGPEISKEAVDVLI